VIIEAMVGMAEEKAGVVVMEAAEADTDNHGFFETARNAPFFVGDRLSMLSYLTAILSAF